jgi:hypothetical protein
VKPLANMKSFVVEMAPKHSSWLGATGLFQSKVVFKEICVGFQSIFGIRFYQNTKNVFKKLK